MTANMDILVRARDEASSVFRRVSSASSQTGSRFSRMGSTIATVGKRAAIGLGAVGVAAGLAAKSAIDAASDLNESVSKVGVVFGKNGKDMLRWSTTAATAMGISRQQALESAGTFGNLFRAMKIGTPEAATMSKSMTQLASDLASFNNANPEDVLLALRSGLVGEAEPLRKFGVQLSAARIEAEAMRMGLAKQGEELSSAAKAQAAYSIILKDTKLAQGDFARTSDGVANRQRIVAAQFEDLKAKIGNALLPVWQTMLGWFQKGMAAFQSALPTIMAFGRALFDTIGRALAAVKEGLAKVWAAIGPVVVAFAKDLWSSIQKTWGVIQKNLLPALQHLWQAAKPVLSVIGAVVGVVLMLAGKALPFVTKAIASLVNILAGFTNALNKVIGWVVKAVMWLGDKLVGAFNAVKGVGTGIWDGILSAARTAFNAIASVWNNTVGKLSFHVPDWVPGIGGSGFDVPDIPLMAKGGLVTKPTLAVVGEAGPEAVIPLSRMRDMGGKSNVYVSIGRREFAREADYEITYGGL